MLDYLIVGQGLAGSLLTHRLLKVGARIAVIDQDHHKASSALAAGIVNPITGRRFVKSWRMDELLPFAKEVYAEIEDTLGQTFFKKKHVSMLFRLPETENNWMARSVEPDIVPYVADEFDQAAYEKVFGPLVGGVEYQLAGRLEMNHLIKSWRSHLKSLVDYRTERFDYEALQIEADHVLYKDIKAKRIIFCEGPRGIHNPYFNYLPFNLAKGEVLMIRIPGYPFEDKMVKDGIFIVPLDNGLYWTGSSYDRNYRHEEPTETERWNLISQLKKILKLEFKIEAHLSAVRPTVKDRKPFLGQHPQFSPLYIFNGLGAKGSYLGPYFAKHLVDFLENGIELEQEVNIERFENLKM
jgi:glycine oxidase